ncbi:hypothetical protein F5Y02DRAFT_404244 [Annulohypoxylon stygium]|nr:hypothetical protein F5Y02DRAFT_404244 [Annulohypoxylon stygium]
MMKSRCHVSVWVYSSYLSASLACADFSLLPIPIFGRNVMSTTNARYPTTRIEALHKVIYAILVDLQRITNRIPHNRTRWISVSFQ